MTQTEWLEKYYMEKLSGESYGPFTDVSAASREYIKSTKEFRKWKLKESLKLAVLGLKKKVGV